MNAYFIITILLVLTINIGYFAMSAYAFIVTFGWSMFLLTNCAILLSWAALNIALRRPSKPNYFDGDPAKG